MSTRGGKKPAPLFVDTFALCEWVFQHFGDDARVLPRALCTTALRLLEAVTLALGGRGDERIDEADERLVALRVQIRLAASTGCMTPAQASFALDAADRIGRQIGGWLRSLGPA